MTYISNRNFLVDVAAGLIPGYSHVNKFGHNAAAAAGHDVWDGGGLYAFYPTTAQSCTIVSTSPNDTSAGTGVRTVKIFGLDSNWEEQDETVTMNGTTPVALVNTYLRIFRAYSVTAGSNGINIGVVSITGGGNTAAQIAAGEGQTQQAIYTVPANKTALLLKYYVGVSDSDKNGNSMEFHLMARDNSIADASWNVKSQIALNTLGSTWWQYEFGVPGGGSANAKTDFRITVPDSSIVMGCVGGFDLILIDS
jgi:hypothetical protein